MMRDEKGMGSSSGFGQIVVSAFPTPIARAYERWEQKLASGDADGIFLQWAYLVELLVRALFIVMVAHASNDKGIVDLRRFRESFQPKEAKGGAFTLGTFVDLTLTLIDAYRDLPDRLVAPEFHSLFHGGKGKGARSSKYGQLLFEATNRRNKMHEGVTPSVSTVQSLTDGLFEPLLFLQRRALILATKGASGPEVRIFRGLQPSSDVPADIEWVARGAHRLKKVGFHWVGPNGRSLHLWPFYVQEADDRLEADQDQAYMYLAHHRGREIAKYKPFGSGKEAVGSKHLYREVRAFFLPLLRERAQPTGNRLEWGTLRTIAQGISGVHGAGIESKYDGDLFAGREKELAAIGQFLDQTERNMLALVGDSGVGKSCLVWHTYRERKESEDCFFIYPAQALDPRKDVIATLAEDVTKALGKDAKLDGTDAFERKLQELCLANPDNRVVLVVDAVNEAPDPKGVMELLMAFSKHVKILGLTSARILLICRPGCWRVLRRRMNFVDEWFFRLPHARYPWLDIEPFDEGEARAAFLKYCKKRHINTAYDDLPLTIRKRVRHPFWLSVVTLIFQRDGSIPASVDESDIMRRFLKLLQQEQSMQLREADLAILRESLVPAMLQKPACARLDSARIEQIDRARYQPNAEETLLGELFDGSDFVQVPGGQNLEPVTQRFFNLVDAGILYFDLPDPDHEYQYNVYFRFDHYFEYFATEHISADLDGCHTFQLALARIRHWVGQAASLSQLTPAVERGLYRWMSTGGKKKGERFRALRRLAAAEDDTAGKIVVRLAVRISEGGEDEEARLLERELLSALGADFWTRKVGIVRSFLRRKSSFSREQVAIQAAEQARLDDVLCRGMLHSSTSVRAMTAVSIFRIFLDDPDAALRLVDLARRRCHVLGIPRPGLLAECVVLSFGICFDSVKETHCDETVRRLRATWAPSLRIAAKALPVLGPFLTHLLGFGLKSIPIETNPVNYFEIERSFRSCKAHKELYRRLLEYFDPNHGHFADIRADVIEAARKGPGSFYFVIVVCEIRAFSRRDEIPEIMDCAVEIVKETAPQHSVVANGVAFIPSFVILGSPDLAPDLQEACLSAAREIEHALLLEADLSTCGEHYPAYIGPLLYPAIWYKVRGTYPDDMLPGAVGELAGSEQGRAPLFNAAKYLLQAGIDLGDGRGGVTSAILDAVRMIIQHDPCTCEDKDSFADRLCQEMANFRLYCPDEIETFFAQCDFPESFREKVRHTRVKEEIGHLITFRCMNYYAKAFSDPETIPKIITVFTRYLEEEDFGTWMKCCAKFAFNQAGGEHLFDV
jgi:hypothetical protein